MKKVTYIIALVLVLTANAMAQRADDGALGSDQGIAVQMAFGAGGVETTLGTYDEINEKCWSNTFAVNGSDRSETYHFTISMDYLVTKPGVDNNVTGGTWTLAVYKSGVYSGMLYGTISGGYIIWKSDRDGNLVSRYTAAKINVLGGTDAFENIETGLSGVFSATSEVGTVKPKAKASIEIGF